MFCIEGPAIGIIRRNHGDVREVSVEELVEKSELIICGTSYSSDLEVEAIRLAKRAGKRCVAFLDHWFRYRKRFLRDGKLYLPDEVWVCDEWAEERARIELPEVLTVRKENYYLNEIRTKYEERKGGQDKPSGMQRVLYVCEPVREDTEMEYGDPMYWGYTEEKALEFFLSRLEDVVDRRRFKIVIRRHPSEEGDKYQEIVDRTKGLDIGFSREPELLDDICWSDIVVGCGTMAMVVALECGKQVVSSLPPDGKTDKLPHPGIRYLRDQNR